MPSDDNGADDDVRLVGKECPMCGYRFDVNLPGVDTREEPLFTHKRPERSTVYICSTVCMEAYLERCDFTHPRGPEGPIH